jgi:hypothetical protein
MSAPVSPTTTSNNNNFFLFPFALQLLGKKKWGKRERFTDK